ncbi:MAG: PadR family transcriptional regulator [Proteobacteria bacterium]|nr:PadR family transcriptional regulator [Pseudomonadota bacterium]
MFGDRHERHGRGHWGHWGEHAREHHRGRHRGERFMEHGDLRFVVLALIAEQPHHGYELIKTLEERTGGAYRPSPGVIYPLLSMLEDEGFIRPANAEGGRKLFEITPEGQAALDQNKAGVDAIFGRMDHLSQASRQSGHRVGRAMGNLGMVLSQRMRRPITDEQMDKMIAMLDDTAAAIEKL